MAVVQIILIIAIISTWLILEKIITNKYIFDFWLLILPRKTIFVEKQLFIFSIIFLLISILGIINAFLWGIGENWFFPNIFPNQFTFDHIENFIKEFQEVIFISIIIGVIVSFISIVITLMWVEISDYLNLNKII